MKIGFIGMSGIRAKDEKLLALGLTLPGFVDRSRVVASLPSLGLLYLAAVTPRGHELTYYEAPSANDIPDEAFRCDLVAISSLSAQIREAYALAARLRSAGVRVALGGLHVSVMPEEAFEYADDVVVGEGENIWPRLVEAAEKHGPRKIWNAKDFPPVDVGSLPVPRYDLLEGRRYNRFTVQTSRGCPWRCEFCASSVMLRERYRKRPIENIVRDIRRLQELFEDPFIEFADDNTFVDKNWGKKLCRALIPLGIKWFTETDQTVSDDEELLELMRRSGCRQVLIGLESPNSASLSGLELRTDFKARVWSRQREAIARIQSHGVTVNGCFILGLDHQTTEIFPEILRFTNETGLYEVQITLLTPFPGTPLYRRLASENRLLHPTDWDLCTLFDLNFIPRGMTGDELREGLYWLSAELYSETGVKRRRRKFFAQLKRKTEDIGLIIDGRKRA